MKNVENAIFGPQAPFEMMTGYPYRSNVQGQGVKCLRIRKQALLVYTLFFLILASMAVHIIAAQLKKKRYSKTTQSMIVTQILLSSFDT